MSRKPKSAMVVGAGAAGLAAARVLAEAGMPVTVLEARTRIGGRIASRPTGNTPDSEWIELGAQFVHGKPLELSELIKEARLESFELGGSSLCHEQNPLQECEDAGEVFSWVEKLKGWSGPDCTFSEYLDQNHIQGRLRRRLAGYIEGFNAADQNRIGVWSLRRQQEVEDRTEGNRLFHLRRGYQAIPSFLNEKIRAAQGTVLLDRRILSIHWRPGEVTAITEAPGGTSRFKANCAVIALPLGVVQARSVEISPEPTAILKAADRMAMGEARRIDLLFQDRFWIRLGPQNLARSLARLSFLHAPDEILPVWWTAAPEETAHLTGWAGGPAAARLAGLSGKQLELEACAALSHIFGIAAETIRRLLVQSWTHDWSRDPFSRGAYSYVPAGALDAPEEMSHPVDNTLFFAGEHTDTGAEWGTVQAALRTGHRAARQILSIEPPDNRGPRTDNWP